MVIKHAMNWKQLGRNLEIDSSLLNIIEKNNPNDCESCCTKMLSEWLDVTPAASWQMLFNAMDKTKNELSEEPHVAEKLNTLVDNLPDTLEKVNTIADNLPDVVDKLGTVADALPDTVEKLDSVVNKLPKAMDQICEAANKLSKSADKVHIEEGISLDYSTGNCGSYIYIHTYILMYKITTMM